MRHGLRGRMNSKSAQRLGDESHRSQRAQAKPQIPIRRIPESWVQTARSEGGASTENRGRYGNKILNEESLYEQFRRHKAFRKRARPRSETLPLGHPNIAL